MVYGIFHGVRVESAAKMYQHGIPYKVYVVPNPTVCGTGTTDNRKIDIVLHRNIKNNDAPTFRHSAQNFKKNPVFSFRDLPDAKLFNGLYLLRIGFDFGMRHAHVKEVPVSNPIT